jgi:hypothetical protein
MATINEVIEDSKFNDFLNRTINAYSNRPSPGKGLRYKRTPFDGLKDEGKFNAENIRAEFVKIANRETSLSRSMREAITSIVFEAARQTVQFREQKAKEAEKAKAVISEVKKRTERAKQ